jgi:hypothetical protein
MLDALASSRSLVTVAVITRGGSMSRLRTTRLG